MKIVVISGSPHKEGTSAVLVDEFIRGAEEAKHEVFRFDAAFSTIHPCNACDMCLTNGGECVFHDDMDVLENKIIEADAVIFASPIYYNDICGQLKITIDRFYAKDAKMKGPKKTALLLSFADDTMETIEGVTSNFKATAQYFGWKLSYPGIIAALGCSTAEDVKRTEIPKHAYALGKNL